MEENPNPDLPFAENPDQNPPLFESRTDLHELSDAVSRIKAEIGKIIVGQHRMVELLVAAILSDGHVLIEGVPGVAKTLSAKLLSRSISVKFSRLQFTPDLMPSDVIGTSVFNQKLSEFEFHRGPVFANLVLIDEVNRAPAKTQSALFEAMEERQVTVDGTTYRLEPPYMVVATQNPIEQEGTYRLPEAQLDRFLFKIDVGYPNVEEEEQILTQFHERKGVNDLDSIFPVLTGEQVGRFQRIVKGIFIEPKLISYIVRIIDQTRNNKDLYLGASPRASLYLMTTAKAIAAMRGRDFVTPDDVQFMAGPVLRHRIILTPEKEMEGGTPDDIIRRILEHIEVPR
jgi:MoxR-like ATPase